MPSLEKRRNKKNSGSPQPTTDFEIDPVQATEEQRLAFGFYEVDSDQQTRTVKYKMFSFAPGKN